MSEGPSCPSGAVGGGSGKKRLKDLRVTDLKTQLEKRGLATSGVKAVLLERLSKHLEEKEGLNVEEEIDFEAPGILDPGIDESLNEEEGQERDQRSGSNGIVPPQSQEDDAIHLMIEDEENLFEEETPRPGSPPKPETAPVHNPFTSRDTISLSSRSKAPSENSSLLVNPDEEASSKGKEEEDDDAGDSMMVDVVPQSSSSSKRGRNLWVSGLASSIRATDLKKAFSEHGKVIGAKVVTNTRSPGARCYGYITMGSPEEATACIERLNKTELHNRVITVERSKSGESGPPPKKDSEEKEQVDQEEDKKAKKNDLVKEENRKEEQEGSLSGKGKSVDKDNSFHPRNHASYPRGRSRSPHGYKRRPPPHFRQRLPPGDARYHIIRDASPPHRGEGPPAPMRDKEGEEDRRLRFREMRRLEEERLRRESERRRRSEEERFERERLELRREREKIEREKAELLKLERERQRFERERLQREKEELERLRWENSRLEDSRRVVKRGPLQQEHQMPHRGAPYYEDHRKMSNRYNNSHQRSYSTNRGGSRYDSSSSRGLASRRGEEESRVPGRAGHTRHYPTNNHAWHSSGASKSHNYQPPGGNDWNSSSRGSSHHSNIPRPPILTGISMGLNSYASGSSGGLHSGGNNHFPSGANGSHDRYDAYKSGNMPQKQRY